ncbi:MAG: two-component regulator propeller domain-containing protein, partial [candidate division WOR-3 bacterium]
SVFRTVYRFAAATEVFDLVVAGSSIYLATRQGLFQADAPDSTRFSVVLGEDVRALLVGQVIWAGCGGSEQSGRGLRYAASGQGWTGFWNTCIASDIISDCELVGTGEFYLCHDGGPITRVRADKGIEVLWSVLPIPKQVRVDSRGRAWFAHFAVAGGLSRFDPDAGSWEAVQWGASSAWNIVDAFGLDRHDTKWVFNGGGVIVAIDSGGRQTVYEVSGLAAPPGGLYEFAFDKQDRVWLGLTVGLVMVDYRGTLHDRRDDRDTVIGEGLPSREVRSVAVDGQGNVWVGTPQGVAVWNGREVRSYTTANSKMVSNNVYRVRVDGSDRVWILSDAGLSIFDQVSNSWETFTPQNSGLVLNPQGLSNFFTGLAVSDEVGRALVGSLRGLSVLDYAAPQGRSAEQMRVYPNPCVLGRHQGLVIDSLPDDAFRVEIRTLDGRPVAELRMEAALRRAVWRPGEQASGLYLVVVTTPRGTALARAAVVRP